MSNYISSKNDEHFIHEKLPKLELADAPPAKSRNVKTPIVFSAYAWEKLRAVRDTDGQKTEVTCYAICKDPENPYYIHDLMFPKQACGMAHVDIEMGDFEDKIDQLLDSEVEHPYQVNSIWIHTHPGSSATPSSKDMETFEEKKPDLFFIMLIVSNTDEYTARMKVKNSDTTLFLPVEVDGEYVPTEEDKKEWDSIYRECVNIADRSSTHPDSKFATSPIKTYGHTSSLGWTGMDWAWDFDGSSGFVNSKSEGIRKQMLNELDPLFYSGPEMIEKIFMAYKEGKWEAVEVYLADLGEMLQDFAIANYLPQEDEEEEEFIFED